MILSKKKLTFLLAVLCIPSVFTFSEKLGNIVKKHPFLTGVGGTCFLLWFFGPKKHVIRHEIERSRAAEKMLEQIDRRVGQYLDIMRATNRPTTIVPEISDRMLSHWPKYAKQVADDSIMRRTNDEELTKLSQRSCVPLDFLMFYRQQLESDSVRHNSRMEDTEKYLTDYHILMMVNCINARTASAVETKNNKYIFG